MSEQIIQIKSGSPHFEAVERIYSESFPVFEQMSLSPFICCEDGSAALYASLNNDTVQGFISFLRNQGLLYIFFLAVDKNIRNRGIGTKLVEFILNKYPNDRIFLNREALYEGAKDPETRVRRGKFYKRLGFKTVGKPHVWRNEFWEKECLRGEVSEEEVENFWQHFEHLWESKD